MKKRISSLLLFAALACVNAFGQTPATFFEPGKTIVYVSDLANSSVDAMPEGWKLVEGYGCKVAELNGEKAIKIEGERTSISPAIDGSLSDAFTVEYEVWSDTECPAVPFHNLNIELTDSNNDIALMLIALNPCVGPDHNELNYEFIKPTGVRGASAVDGSKVNGAMKANSWTKVQLSYSNGQCTYYINGTRMMKPVAIKKPTNVRITGIDSEEVPFFVRNFRLAR